MDHTEGTTGGAVDADALSRLYRELSFRDQMELDTFLDQVCQGEYGRVADGAVEEFLRFTRRMVIDNIELKASEHARFQEVKQERIQEVEARFQRLLNEYTGANAGPSHDDS